MEQQNISSSPADLTGTVDDRRMQLLSLAVDALDIDWLRRQLDSALIAWAACETELDIQKERHVDY